MTEEELQKGRDDFWTSVGIMQGGKNVSVLTERLKGLQQGMLTLKEATPEGENTSELLLRGAIIDNLENN